MCPLYSIHLSPSWIYCPFTPATPGATNTPGGLSFHFLAQQQGPSEEVGLPAPRAFLWPRLWLGDVRLAKSHFSLPASKSLSSFYWLWTCSTGCPTKLFLWGPVSRSRGSAGWDGEGEGGFDWEMANLSDHRTGS